MKYNYKNKYTLIFCLAAISFMLCPATASAQVTVGADVEPESFSIVQVEGQAGIRLPKISNADKTAMETILQGKPKAVGLTVYNSSAGKIEFWDGSSWITLMDSISAENGLTHAGYSMKLGGKLTESLTNVDLDGFNLDHGQATGGKYAINDTMVVVNNKIVDIRPAGKFSVNDTVISLEGKFLEFSPNSLSVNNGVLEVNSSAVSINGNLNYTDGNQNSGYLLSSDDEGNAYWAPLRPLGTIIEGELNNSIGFANSEVNITRKTIELPPGQWLIFAKYAGQMTASTSGMAHWILLYQRTVGASVWSNVTRAGANPESLSSGSSYSTPNLLYYANITQETEFRVSADTSNNGSDTTTDEDWAGRSYFFAVRLDIPIY